MKPNKPNVGSEKKTFAKLNGLTIVGNSVTQNPDISTPNLLDDSYKKKIANRVFKSTTPSLIKGDKGDNGDKGDKGDTGDKGYPAQLPEPPETGLWILGSLNGSLSWIPTENCIN